MGNIGLTTGVIEVSVPEFLSEQGIIKERRGEGSTLRLNDVDNDLRQVFEEGS